MAQLDAHPLALCWPEISPADMELLVEDVREKGVLEPVVIYDGQILDGRHRYAAALTAGVDCPQVEYQGTDPVGFVQSKNSYRRHISKLERTAALDKMMEWQSAAVGSPTPTHQDLAAAADVSINTARRARHVNQVARGEEPSAPSIGAEMNQTVRVNSVRDRESRVMDRLETAEEMVRFYEDKYGPEPVSEQQRMEADIARIKSLRMQMQEWQQRYEDERKLRLRVERERDTARERNRQLEMQLLSLGEATDDA